MEFATIIVDKVVEKLIDPVIRQFSYVLFYKSNMKSLMDCVEDLQRKKSDVMRSVDAHNRNLEIIGQDVEAWLSNVEKNNEMAQEVLEDKKIVNDGCLNGRCPNLKQRYMVSRKAVKQIMVAKVLQEEGGKYTQFAYPALPEGTTMTSLSRFVPEVFESRISQTKEVIEALKDKSFWKIGICGLAGVGKTSMTQEICQIAKAEQLFDEFAVAVVTENQDLKKIQDELASMLGLKLDEKYITNVRGNQLHQRLTNGKRILVILDDVWNKLDLNELGIPVGAQVESSHCKVIITSRDEHVCTATGTDKNFVVKLLSDTEAWDLFKEKSGVVDESDLCLIARKICEECGRLPLAIVTVSTALKGKEKVEWKDALRQLEMSNVTSIEGMEKDVYSRLRLSYNLLQNNQLRHLFLLCCIFPEDYDIPVEQLVRYAVGLRLFANITSLEIVREKVKSLVNQLKRCYLLLASDTEGHVKVHDVLRDFGLKEASHGDHVYLSRHHGEVQQLLQTEIIKSHTAISIGTREELKLLPGLDCPSLKLLELSSKCSLQLSESYFGKMKEIKVAAFCGQLVGFDPKDTSVESPPKTLQFFLNVQTLCLEQCRFSSDIRFIGSMQNLEILSFFRSEIDVLPSEIGQLDNLKLLDLRGCTVGLISSGVLLALQKLEDLYMGCYFFEQGAEKRNNGNCASITELCSLSALKTLQVSISEPEVYSKLQDFFFDKLTSFNISINAGRDHTRVLYFPNTAKIEKIDLSNFAGAKLEALLTRAEVLHVSNVNGWDTKIRESDIDVYTDLKELILNGESGLLGIFRGSVILGCPVRPPCFANLNVFHLAGCDNVRSLFSASTARCLVQLQKLEISECTMLEEVVIKNNAQIDKDAKVIIFPKLKDVSLLELPCFRSFYSAPGTICSEVSSGGCFFSKDALLPCTEKLYLISKSYVYDPEMTEPKYAGMTMFPNLQTLIDLESVEVLDENTLFLGQLEIINIEGLDGLLQIWKNVPKGVNSGSFCKLRELHVEECNSLTYLFCPTIAKMLVNLYKLDVSGCYQLKQVMTKEDEEQKGKTEMVTIVFPQLNSLRLYRLPSLTSFYDGSCYLDFPLLFYVYAKGCKNMDKFCSGPVSTPKLESVKHGFGVRKRVWGSDLNGLIKRVQLK